MKPTIFKTIVVLMIALLTVTIACGTKSSDDPVATTAVTGVIFAAPVSGSSVVVKDAAGNTIAGPVTTSVDGTYSANVPSTALANDLRIEAVGGSFTDEVTGTATTAGTLAAYVSGGSLSTTQTVNLDPSSTIVHALVSQGGKTIGEANSIFNAAFGYTPDTSIEPRNAASSGSDSPQRLAGFRAGVFSQLARDMSLTPDQQFDLMAAIARDLADDGRMNGSTGTVNGAALPEDLQNRFELALVSYQSNTTHNLTGVTPDQIGSPPFARVVLTSTYRVEYVPGMMAAAQGKTSFKIKVTKRSDGSAATGLSLSLMPMMHMAAMRHATPFDAVTESATPGTYTCTVYYLMASGPGMGYWELKVMISNGMGMGESATFFPAVGMAMGTDTIRTTLKGQSDIITSMTGTEKRSYYLFNDGPLSSPTASFKLFIAAKESMMSYPVVSVGAVLSSPTGTVTSMSVQASSDGGTTWIAATDNTKGHWSVSGFSNLVSNTTATIQVKLVVNGEDKTTNGLASNPTGTNGYATFLVKTQ